MWILVNSCSSLRNNWRIRKRLRPLCVILFIVGVAQWVTVVVTAEDTSHHRAGGEVIPGDPFFVVSTVDGSIGVLRALDGSLVSGFRSGVPLVTPSEVLAGGRRIVPGLDGRLYVSLEDQEGILQPLEITVVDVLQTPVKTCSSGGTNCGIVTATKSTSLFALDALTGILVWKQSKNGSTTIEVTNDEREVTSTVLLQREDVLVQQLSTDSGKSVWNATLGTVQALEFGEGNSGSEGTLPSRSRGAYLPSGSLSDSRQLLMRDYIRGLELPSVIFGSDGTSLMAVTESKEGDVHILWTREFPTVVASVFGLQDRTWKPLTVLELPVSADGGTQENDRLIGGEPSTRSLTLYRPSMLQQLFSHWSKPMSFLDRLADDWFFATGQQHPHARRQHHHSWRPLEISSHHLMVPRKHTLAPLLPHDDLMILPQLALPPPHASGIYLTWPLLFGICLAAVGLAGLMFRFLYLHKKSKWRQSVQEMAIGGFLGMEVTKQDIPLDEKLPENSPLKRSRSLPDVTAATIVEQASTSIATRRLRSESLQISHTPDGRLVYDKHMLAGIHEGETSTTGANTSNIQTTTKAQEQQTQGVDFLVDGIPLIRYNRYDSEFTEVVALGKGGFGTVFRCKNVLDGREYAIKKVSLKYKENLPLEEFRQRLQRTLREVKSLALLDHPNIVRYYTAWLELQQQQDEKMLGHGTSSHGMADSDYYLLSPSTNNTRDQDRKMQSISHTDGIPKNYLFNGCHHADNPLGGWSGFDETTNDGNVSAHPFMAGVPAALDDYGFTFDRGDENADSPDHVISARDETNKKDVTSRSAADDKEKSLGFYPHGPTIHRYSHNYSLDGEPESSIEGSVSQTESAWSQSERRVGNTDSSTEEPNDSRQASIPAAMVRHILYIQMQFCSLKTLADFLANAEARQGGEGSGRVDIPYALSLFLQIAQGVEHVHSQGLIHRDLKPNNCFMDDSGAVKVGDFGLSRESASDNRDELETVDELVDEDETPKDAGNCREITAGVGTRSYASPEQMKGSDYDASTDIYSLGIMLFELCYPMYTVSVCDCYLLLLFDNSSNSLCSFLFAGHGKDNCSQ